MLRTLSIQNLAVIADVQVELDDGLNVFTGTTGAGKSLVIGALELLLGLRASSDMVRSGADEARVSALFEIRNSTLRDDIREICGIPLEDGQMVIQRRIPSEGGGSRASLNGEPITAGMLRKVGQLVVDIHGQFDQQYLLHPANQLQVLDAYGRHEAALSAYQATYQKQQSLLGRKRELEQGDELRRRQLELYQFQADEIDRAAVQEGEIDELTRRRDKLAGAERLAEQLSGAYQTLYENQDSVVDRLKTISQTLDSLSQIDADLQPQAATARDAAFMLEDLSYQLRSSAESVEFDSEALVAADERLHLLKRLADKYGGSDAAILETRRQLAEKIAQLSDAEIDAAAIDGKLSQLDAELQSFGGTLRAARKKTALTLQKRIEKQLGQLQMKGAQLVIAVEPLEDSSGQPVAGPHGLDAVEFLIAPNPGEPPKPLRKIASGGELSRVMLALKGVLSLADRVSVLVFDEIDSNIGGRLGSVIGSKLSELARRHQVLCITHLPQIAAFGDRQLTVRKASRQGRSFSSIEMLTGEERVAELAEMISGASVTETTLRQARELLKEASQASSAAATVATGETGGGR